MSVQAKLSIYAIVAMACALVLASALVLAVQKMNSARQEIVISDGISQGATELNTLTYDYLLAPESRPAQQWKWVHAAIGRQLAAREFKNPQEQAVVKKMTEEHQAMGVVFADLVRLGSPPPEASESSELATRLASQLLTHARAIVSDSFQLASLNRAHIEEVQQRATYALALFITVLLALMMGIIYLTNTSVARPLMKAQDQLKEAQAVSRVGSWEWDIPQNKMIWSDEMYKIYGYTPQEFAATSEKAMESVLEEDKKRINQDVSELLKNPQPGQHQIPGIDYTIVLPGRNERVLHGESSLLVSKNGKPVKLTGTVQDVTESHLARTELERSKNELERINKFMIGREHKMVELKKEIAELKNK